MSSSSDVRKVEDVRKIKDTSKEGKEERKRRIKTTGSGDSGGNLTISVDREPKRIKVEKATDQRTVVTKSSVYNEEEEATTRSAEKDLHLYKAACNEIRTMMKEIKELKDASSQDADELAERRIHGSLQFVTLKKLNRLGHIRCKKVREETHEAKVKIDQHHLQLQNLLYEVMHLQKEITKCLEFKSKHEQIDLVPVEIFYKEAPKGISKPDVTRNDVHKQTIARLDWEQEQRVTLSEKLKTAEAEKGVISKDIRVKQEYLESLQPKLNDILQSTKPVQEYLGMPFDEVREQHRAAQYLPSPLYVLYVQTSAYKDACDKNMKVTIVGDLDEAKSYENSVMEPEEDSDQDDADQEEQDKKSARRRKSGDRKSQKREKLLKKHPLTVEVQLRCKGGATLHLTFYYLPALYIVTVDVKLSVPGDAAPSNSISGGDLVSSEHLLNCLYPGDRGTESPNPASQYELSQLGMESLKSVIVDIGHPYQWAQWLAGLQFVGAQESTPKAETSVSSGHMEETIRKLKARVRARLALQKQLAVLESGQVVVSKEYQSLFPSKISSQLVSWKRSTYQDVATLPYCQEAVETDLVREDDNFFTAVVERGSAKATVQVAVHADYPSSAPIFLVCVDWIRQRTSLTDESVRDMEAEVNLYCEELCQSGSADQLLTNQMKRLLMCLDVYLEVESTESGMEGPKEFAKERLCPRSSRGPNRGKPYKYNVQQGIFCHR